MSGRRSFIKNLGHVGLGAFGTQSLFNELLEPAIHAADREALKTKNDEDYWKAIQNAFSTNSSGIIELNNGGVSPSPLIVQKALEKYNVEAAQAPSYFMWRKIDAGREQLRTRLAILAGCDPEEIAIDRNTTEALNSIIYGLDFQPGDEVIGTIHDYPNMMNAWKQRAARNGLIYKQLTFNLPVEEDEIVIDAFRKAITPKTKLIHITHIINSMGQIMPVRKVCDMAHDFGVPVLVDGAHSFGLLDFKIPDLNCDYFATSLHKFLCAPTGSGLMWIKKELIKDVWPLLCHDNPRSDNIRKFESIGTRSFCIEQAIGEAINFHEAIGSRRKEDRLRYLKNYWAGEVITNPRIRLNTSLKPEFSCVIGSIKIEGIETSDLLKKLFDEYKIHATGFNQVDVDGVRITPNVYTRTEDLDILVQALFNIANS